MGLLIGGIAIIGIVLWVLIDILKETLFGPDCFIHGLIVFIISYYIIKYFFIWLF